MLTGGVFGALLVLWSFYLQMPPAVGYGFGKDNFETGLSSCARLAVRVPLCSLAILSSKDVEGMPDVPQEHLFTVCYGVIIVFAALAVAVMQQSRNDRLDAE